MKKCLTLLATLVVLTGCGDFVGGVQAPADFFKCAPVNGEDVLVACAPGTTLTGCEPIGTGMTDKPIIDCQ